MNEQAIAARIQKTRIKHRWSQSELARRAKCTQQQISRIEAGKWSPTIGTLMRILRALDIELSLRSETTWNPFTQEFDHE
jgi:transcriptional regulator with XRE-family HTH domain